MSPADKPTQCSQAGFLPVPLACVPAESLSGLKIYLNLKGEYSLYRTLERSFGAQDVERLLSSKVEYVYVSISDHRIYYETIEKAIGEIIADSHIQAEKKAEILYATSLELSNQLLSAPPGKEEVQQASKMARATVEMILHDNSAFKRLYEVFSHDLYTASHMVNVCGLTVMLAQKMGLVDVQVLQELGTGGLLHDVGKIFVPDEILNTPQKLTTEQFDKIKEHVELGCGHLEKVMTLTPPIRSVVAEHHERMDGSGYPRGLKGDEISPLGKLAAIVDSFDAMTSVRPYRNHAFSIGETLEKLEAETPDKYDAEILNAFVSLVEQNDELTSGSSNDSEQVKRQAVGKVGLNKWGEAHTQYYFRIQVMVRKAKRKGDGIAVFDAQKVLSHRLTCMGFSFLSSRPYAKKELVVISSKLLESIGLNNLLAQVISSKEHRESWYTVETRFLQPRSPEEIAQIKTKTTVTEMSPLLEN